VHELGKRAEFLKTAEGAEMQLITISVLLAYFTPSFSSVCPLVGRCFGPERGAAAAAAAEAGGRQSVCALPPHSDSMRRRRAYRWRKGILALSVLVGALGVGLATTEGALAAHTAHAPFRSNPPTATADTSTRHTAGKALRRITQASVRTHTTQGIRMRAVCGASELVLLHGGVATCRSTCFASAALCSCATSLPLSLLRAPPSRLPFLCPWPRHYHC
jgi:hypothetical protein